VRATLLLACAHGRHVELLNDLVARELDKSISVGTLFRTNSVTTKFVREFLILSSSDFLRNVMQATDQGDRRRSERLRVRSGQSCRRAPRWASGSSASRSPPTALSTASTRTSRSCRATRASSSTASSTTSSTASPGTFAPVAAGFLFLRFLCPAILAPQIFHLVPEAPQGDAQRALVLVAKVMQNLANGVEFGKKEAFLEPLNKWLRAKLPQVEILYERLTVVQGTPFDAKREAGDPAPHVAVIIRRGMSRIVQLTKAAEDAQSMDALGALIRLKELCE
jgi:hypothetical protein